MITVFFFFLGGAAAGSGGSGGGASLGMDSELAHLPASGNGFGF